VDPLAPDEIPVDEGADIAITAAIPRIKLP
jgi:hypothetical protein